MKNGLCEENGKLIYYQDGVPFHAGVVKDGEYYYYIGHGGYAVRGQHVVHKKMSHGLLPHGTYTFGEDYRLVEGSYHAPKKKSSEKKKKKKIRIRKTTKILLLFAALLLIVLLGVLGVGGYRYLKKGKNTDPGLQNKSESIVLPEEGDEVVLCSDAAYMLYGGQISASGAVKYGSPYQPFTFSYSLPEGSTVFRLSRNPDMSDADEFLLTANEKSCTVDNLETSRTYYYEVEIDGSPVSGSFKTAQTTRFLYIPNIKNVRDIGGYTNVYGETVRQGLLIRGSEIDGLTNSSCILKKDAYDRIADDFSFAFEMDLRDASLFNETYKTRFGEGVRHRYYKESSALSASLFDADFQAALRAIFADLAQPTNYPMYLHCTDGADRTGIVCFFLEAVLNLPEKVMEMDYHLSGFYESEYAGSETYNAWYGALEGYSGDTAQEKIVSYLTGTVGVSEDEIESIRCIFLES